MVEPRLTNATRWYLGADLALLPCLEYAYLAGSPGVYRAGLRTGFEDDTAELDEFVLDHVARERRQHGELTSADARPTHRTSKPAMTRACTPKNYCRKQKGFSPRRSPHISRRRQQKAEK
jgi:hypothetical protein